MHINLVKKVLYDLSNYQAFSSYSKAYQIIFNWTKKEIERYYNQNGVYPDYEYMKKNFNKWKLYLKENSDYDFIKLRHYVLLEAIRSAMDYYIENNPYQISKPYKKLCNQFFYPPNEIKFEENRIKLIKAPDTIIDCKQSIYNKYLYGDINESRIKKVQFIRSTDSQWYMNTILTFNNLKIRRNIYIKIRNDREDFLVINVLNKKNKTNKNYRIKFDNIKKLFYNRYYKNDEKLLYKAIDNDFNIITNRVISSLIRIRPNEIIFIERNFNEKKLYRYYQKEFVKLLKNKCKENKITFGLK